MGADEELQPLGRTLSFASKTASLSICGGSVTAVQTTGGATSSDHTAARGLSKNASAPTLPLGATGIKDVVVLSVVHLRICILFVIAIVAL